MKNKTYIEVLGLFLILLYLLLGVFCFHNTQRNVARLKESYLREYHFLVTNMTKDLWIMKNRDYTLDEALEICFYSYKQQYEKDLAYLQINKKGVCLYSNFIDKKIIPSNREKIRNCIMSVNQKKYMTISSCLLEPFEDYSLVYYIDVTKVVNEWHKNNFSLFGAVTIFSGILSICLAILLESLFKPLEKISLSSARIADGAYEEKLDIRGEGEIRQVVGSFNRMSDKIREQMKALQKYAEEKQRLIDNLAHELKTPLTAIYGYAEYIQKTNLDEKKKYTATQFILRESKRIENISKMLLEMAVLREEKRIDIKAVEVGRLFERLYQIEEIKLNEKGITLNYSCQFNELYGNEDLLEGMLINLIDNAIRACKPMEGKIWLNAYEEEGQKRIEIRDNGKGMTSEQLSHITEPFYRVDKARSRKDGGNGLGLALCEEIAKKHGAQLFFDSTLGEGTSVKIIFLLGEKEQNNK